MPHTGTVTVTGPDGTVIQPISPDHSIRTART
jgi:hypothetical protein